MADLIVLVGISGSGKSTAAQLYKEKSSNTLIVSTDALRKELLGSEEDQTNGNLIFKAAYDLTRKYLVSGHNVIFDATNLTARARKQLLRECGEYAEKRICRVYTCSVDEAMEHQKNRVRQVPREVVEAQYKKFIMPSASEGWDSIDIMF